MIVKTILEFELNTAKQIVVKGYRTGSVSLIPYRKILSKCLRYNHVKIGRIAYRTYDYNFIPRAALGTIFLKFTITSTF